LRRDDGRPRKLEILRLAAVLLLAVAAPVVGDIGSCGEPPADLDAAEFFRDKAGVDCARCGECGFATAACTRACDPKQAPTSFDEGCFPIRHDGEVCLHALEAASCEIYAAFVADQGATVPTECNFCPAEGQP
jgi:hypothetical protein